MAQRRLCAFRRPVFLNQVEPRQRNIEPCAFRILQQHELGVAIALVDFLQALILPNAVLDVDHVIAHLQVAEVGKECGNLGLRALRTRNHRIGLIEQIARAENRQVSVGQYDAVRHIGFDQRAGEDFACEIGGLVGVTFAATSAAAQTEGKSVLAENVGQALDFADIRDRDQHAILFADLLLDLLQHCWNRAMKALRRLRMESDRLGFVGTRNFEMLNRSAPGRLASFCHQSSGWRYKSVGRTRFPTSLRSWASSIRDQV